MSRRGRGRALLRLGLLFRLSGRNVLRQARRSVLTMAAMVLGLGLLMMSRAIADGAHEKWIESGVRLAAGEVALQAPGYLKSAALSDRLSPAQLAGARRALAAPAVARRVAAVAPRLSVSGLASAPGGAVAVQVQGVDPAAEAAFSELDARKVAGRYLEPEDRLAVYIGQRLAERLDLEVGSRLVLTAQAAGGQIEGQLVRVVGIFRSGIPEMDEGLVQIPLETARSWLGARGGATTVAVLLHSVFETDGVVSALRAAALAGVRVLSWRQASPDLDAAIRIDDFGDYVFHVVLLGIVAMAILNSILMSVLNRTREFGVLRALGLTRRQTGGVVFTEGLLLTVASGVLGILLGLGVTFGFFRHGLDLSALWSQDITVSGAIVDPVLVPIFRPIQVVQSLAFVAVIGVLASLYPAWQAMRIDVAEAMKFDR